MQFQLVSSLDASNTVEEKVMKPRALSAEIDKV